MNLLRVAGVAITAGLTTAVLATAAPAQADPTTDAFVETIAQAGLGGIDPAQAIATGQTVCALLAQPGQNTADIAATVADTVGIPVGPATAFTGIAATTLCPALLSGGVNLGGLDLSAVNGLPNVGGLSDLPLGLLVP